MPRPEERAITGTAYTGKANHPVLLGHGSDCLWVWRSFSMIPSESILLCNLCKFCVHLSRLLVVLLNRLLAMSSEPVLIQRIYVNRKPDRMRSSYTCTAFRSAASTCGCEKHILSLRRESCNGYAALAPDSIVVQPDGGNCLAALQALTARYQHRYRCLSSSSQPYSLTYAKPKLPHPSRPQPYNRLAISSSPPHPQA